MIILTISLVPLFPETYNGNEACCLTYCDDSAARGPIGGVRTRVKVIRKRDA